jgi:mannose-6-phosphate isomerase-like protein (cupin superfamily)
MEKHKKTPQLAYTSGKVPGFQGIGLLDLEKGSLKKVRVLPNSTYPLHIHPNKTEWIYVLSGNPKITIGDATYASEKDDFFALPFNVEHSIENLQNTECELLVGAVNC